MTSRREEPASRGEEMRSLLIGMMVVEIDDEVKYKLQSFLA